MRLNALVLSLPTRNSTIRMRVWRALKETGCGVLRDGVYVLPTAQRARGFGRRSNPRSGRQAASPSTVELKLGTARTTRQVRKFFDRSEDYGALAQKSAQRRPHCCAFGPRKAQTTVNRLRRSFDKLSEIDFFPGQAKLQAADAISTLNDASRRRIFAGNRALPRSDCGKSKGPGIKSAYGQRARIRGWIASPAPGSSSDSSIGILVRMDRSSARPSEEGHRLRFRRRGIHARQ